MKCTSFTTILLLLLHLLLLISWLFRLRNWCNSYTGNLVIVPDSRSSIRCVTHWVRILFDTYLPLILERVLILSVRTLLVAYIAVPIVRAVSWYIVHLRGSVHRGYANHSRTDCHWCISWNLCIIIICWPWLDSLLILDDSYCFRHLLSLLQSINRLLTYQITQACVSGKIRFRLRRCNCNFALFLSIPSNYSSNVMLS
jgi:hypothetical protein